MNVWQLRTVHAFCNWCHLTSILTLFRFMNSNKIQRRKLLNQHENQSCAVLEDIYTYIFSGCAWRLKSNKWDWASPYTTPPCKNRYSNQIFHSRPRNGDGGGGALSAFNEKNIRRSESKKYRFWFSDVINVISEFRLQSAIQFTKLSPPIEYIRFQDECLEERMFTQSTCTSKVLPV